LTDTKLAKRTILHAAPYEFSQNGPFCVQHPTNSRKMDLSELGTLRILAKWTFPSSAPYEFLQNGPFRARHPTNSHKTDHSACSIIRILTKWAFLRAAPYEFSQNEPFRTQTQSITRVIVSFYMLTPLCDGPALRRRRWINRYQDRNGDKGKKKPMLALALKSMGLG